MEIIPCDLLMHEQWDLWMEYVVQYCLSFDGPSVI